MRACIDPGAVQTAYGYDKVGNRTTSAATTVSGTKVATKTTRYTYDAADQVTTTKIGTTITGSYTWDNNGRLTAVTSQAGTRAVSFDLAGELSAVTLEDGREVSYTYDAQGRQSTRLVNGAPDVSWLWDDSSSLPTRVGQFDASGSLSRWWVSDPVSPVAGALASTSWDGTDWLVSDPFQSVVASVSTWNGLVDGSAQPDPFGALRVPEAGALVAEPSAFHGQFQDDLTGWYDLRARTYDPVTGRFLGVDPVEAPVGLAPASGYAYGFSNPLVHVDPTGMWPDWNQAGTRLYNGVVVDTVNTFASVGNSMLRHPVDTVLMVAGTLAMVGGCKMMGGGAVAIATGAGAAPERRPSRLVLGCSSLVAPSPSLGRGTSACMPRRTVASRSCSITPSPMARLSR